MYRVAEKDKIAVRSIDEAFALGDLLAANRKINKVKERKLEKLWNLTGKHLNKAHSANAILNNAYKFVDLAMSDMAAASVCAKSCAHCCKLAVDVTLLEAAYIEKNTGYKMNLNKQRQPERNQTYCPFLNTKTATCKIYKFRPLACRWFFAFDNPVYCENPFASHAISATGGVPANPYLKKLYSYIGQASNEQRFDIRQFFSNLPLTPTQAAI